MYATFKCRRSLMAIAVGSAISAHGGAAEPTDQPGEAAAPAVTVEITGVRSSNLKSIGAKRDAVAMVDTIAADQIGKLPDFNIGDVLKRVTGVATLQYQGEPRFVVVRGLNANYNTTLIDGFTIATADVGGRQVFMEVLPSNFVNRVDVVKSAVPESDGGAIGGVIDMVTGSAFNYRDGLVDLSAKAGRNFGDSNAGGANPVGEAQARWATRFGENKQFGLLTTASYWTRHIHVPQLETGSTLNSYTAAGTRTAFGAGNGYPVPTERRWYNYDNDRERAGLTARLDWDPDSNMKGRVALYDFKQREISNRNDLLAQVDSSATVSNQTPTSGTISSMSQMTSLGRLHWDRALYGINGEFKVDLRPDLSTTVRASQSKSTVSNPQVWDKFIQNGLAFNYDWSGTYPLFTAVSSNADDPKRYGLQYHRIEGTEYEATVRDAQWNLRFNDKEDSRGWGGAIGLRAVQTDSSTSFVRTDYSGGGYTFADVYAGQSICAFTCNTRIPLVDDALAMAAYAKYGPTEKVTVDTASQYGNTFDLRERVSAAYVQGRYRADGWLLVGGVRLEHTNFSSEGYLATNGKYGPTSTSNNYSDVLPSLAGFYDTGVDSKLRFGLSRTVGRARFDQIATHGGALVTSGSVPTLSAGNPDLKPRRSTNFDVGHEWYLDQGRGIVSLALFHKRIRDEIFNYGALQTMGVNGTPTQVLVTQARNTTELTRLSGIEFGVTKDLGFLPAPFNGLGVSVNGSYMKASYPVTLSDGSVKVVDMLQQTPKQLWNVAVYYERGPVHAKVAWSHLGKLWDSRFPNFTPAGFIFNRYQSATDNVDVQFSYDLSKRTSLSLDILNLTSQGQQYMFGTPTPLVQSAWKLYPSVLLGLSLKL